MNRRQFLTKTAAGVAGLAVGTQIGNTSVGQVDILDPSESRDKVLVVTVGTPNNLPNTSDMEAVREHIEMFARTFDPQLEFLIIPAWIKIEAIDVLEFKKDRIRELQSYCLISRGRALEMMR